MKKTAPFEYRTRRIRQIAGARLLTGIFVALGCACVLIGLSVVPAPRRVGLPHDAVVALGGVYLWAAAMMLYARGRAGENLRASLAGARAHHGEPWRHDYPWNPSGVHDRPWHRAGRSAFLVLGWLLVIAPFFWWGWLAHRPHFLGVLMTALLSLALLPTVPRAVAHLWRAVRFGRTQVAFSRFPMAPGERLALTVSPLHGSQSRLTVRFIEERSGMVVRSGGTTVERFAHCLYQAEHVVLHSGGEASVEVDWPLPNEESWVTRLGEDRAVRYWELLIESGSRVLGQRTALPLPVYLPAAGAPVEPLPTLTRADAWLSRMRAAATAVLVLGVPLAVSPAVREVALQTVPAHVMLRLAIDDFDLGSTSVVDLQRVDGATWMASKYSIARVADDGSGDLEFVASRAERRPPLTVSAILAEDDGVVWIGDWRGRLQRLAVSDPVPGPDEGWSRRVHVIERFGEELLVGGARLASVTDRGLEVVEQGPTEPVHDLHVVDDSRLFAAARNGLWRFEGAWVRFTKRSSGDAGPLTALAAGPGDTLLVAFDRGWATFDLDGRAISMERVDAHVRAIAFVRDHVLLGTRDQGLWIGHLASDEDWRVIDSGYGLRADHVADVVVDADNAVWIATYGGNVQRAPARRLIGGAVGRRVQRMVSRDPG